MSGKGYVQLTGGSEHIVDVFDALDCDFPAAVAKDGGALIDLRLTVMLPRPKSISTAANESPKALSLKLVRIMLRRRETSSICGSCGPAIPFAAS
jgi:hypothetical protein